MKPTLNRWCWLSTLALAAAAVQSAGCEIIYIAVAASADEDVIVDYENPSPLCASAAAMQSRNINNMTGGTLEYEYPTEAGVDMQVLGRIPGKGVATADSIAVFFTIYSDDIYDYESILEQEVEVETTGDLGEVEWEACPTLYNQAVAIIHPTRTGKGTITVSVDGDELDSFDLSVAEPTGMTVSFDPNTSVLEAYLTDDQGTPLYAGDILWQIAPFSTTPVTFGNLALLSGGFGGSLPVGTGTQPELTVVASRGDFQASIKLAYDDGRAQWRVAE